MKLFLYPLKTNKTINMLRTYKKYTFILNQKKINKIKLKEYFLKNYSLIVTKINIIKIKHKKKKKIIVNFKNKLKNKFLLNYEKNKKS